MMKFMVSVVIVCLVFCALLWGGLRMVEWVLVQKMPTIMENLSSPVMSVSAQEITSEDCQWQACVVAKNVRLRLLNKEIISVGDMRLKISPIFPWRIDVKTAEDSPIFVDVSLSKNFWQVRQAKGTIGTFRFTTTGFVDGKNNQGNLFMQTEGLRSFLNRFVEIPTWLSLLIRDTQQQITLSPKDGMLNLYGIPLFPLSGY